MGRNKLHVATTPPLFAELGHVHPFRFTPESPDKTRRSVSMSSGGSVSEGEVQIRVHKVRKSLDALSASEVQKDRGAKHWLKQCQGSKSKDKSSRSEFSLVCFPCISTSCGNWFLSFTTYSVNTFSACLSSDLFKILILCQQSVSFPALLSWTE